MVSWLDWQGLREHIPVVSRTMPSQLNMLAWIDEMTASFANCLDAVQEVSLTPLYLLLAPF